MKDVCMFTTFVSVKMDKPRPYWFSHDMFTLSAIGPNQSRLVTCFRSTNEMARYNKEVNTNTWVIEEWKDESIQIVFRFYTMFCCGKLNCIWCFRVLNHFS